MIYIRQGDHRPFAATILSRGGVAVDLTLATSVTFRMREQHTTPLTVLAAADIVAPATNGQVQYEWQDGDTDIPGTYYADWEVLFDDGTKETFPTLAQDVVLISGAVGGV